MKAVVKYFSGTGNSYQVAKVSANILKENGFEVFLSDIFSDNKFIEDIEFIGFCFPVYAFDIPRVCKRYLNQLPSFSKPPKIFIFITAGDETESGFSCMTTSKILSSKNCNLIYSEVIEMPANWTVAMNPPDKLKAMEIIEKGLIKVTGCINDILNDNKKHKIFNYPPRFSKFGYYKEYYLFKWLGLNNLWRNFRTDNSCTGCENCMKVCPTKSIQMKNNHPVWSKTCEQCMRCVNLCSHKAIYQKGYGSVKERNLFFNPDFKPLIINILKSN